MLVLLAATSAPVMLLDFLRAAIKQRRGDGLDVFHELLSEFINWSITSVSTGYSGNISNYFHMSLAHKTNN